MHIKKKKHFHIFVLKAGKTVLDIIFLFLIFAFFSQDTKLKTWGKNA